MDIAMGVTFLILELVFIALVFLVIMQTGFTRLSSSIGIARDGFPPGKKVPFWSLADLEGRLRVTPAGDHWQLLLFANRSLVGFPDLVAGLHHLAKEAQELEVLVLSQEQKDDCIVTARGIELQVPMVPVDQVFYDRFRVRVMPFAIFLDPRGIVCWVGLVNTETQLFHAWRMAKASVYSADPSKVV